VTDDELELPGASRRLILILMSWRVYTREKPARPGLAIVLSALFLVGTVWLASVVTTAKAEPIVLGSRFRSLDWPISFRLPRGSRRVETASAWPEEVQRDGSIGAVAFQIRDAERPGHEDAQLEAVFRILPAGTSAEMAGRMFLGGDFVGGRPISMGPISGLSLRGSPFGPVGQWVAVGCAPEGLAVFVQLIATGSRDRQDRVFHAICESIRFDDWAVRP